MDVFIGTIILCAFSWAPRGFLICDGRSLQINEYQALYSLIGTTYGGNGSTTFCLPNLQGRLPVGAGQLDGGQLYRMGVYGGKETGNVAMNLNNLPLHTHEMNGAFANIPEQNINMYAQVSSANGDRSVAQNNDFIGGSVDNNGRGLKLYTGNGDNRVAISGISGQVPEKQIPVTGNIAPAGNNQPLSFDIRQPYVVMNYMIAYEGLYTDRPY